MVMINIYIVFDSLNPMKLWDLPVPEKLKRTFPNLELRPPQVQAIEKGVLEGRNVVVSSPTASGKTLIAELAGVKNILEGKGKMLYIVPLKSIANEKYKEFEERYNYLKVALSIGDYDSSDPWLEKYDIIITTSEKMDSLIRHRALWVRNVGTLVVDEIHLINDLSRGPTLEVLITKLREIVNAQVIALSATIKNAKEIAEWLGAELVVSDYRPTRLREGVLLGDKIYFEDEIVEIGGKGEVGILKDTLKRGKQVLFFLASRRYAEALAKRLSKELPEELEGLGKEVKNVLPRPTRQCELLGECVKHRVAFHHAGLLPKQRQLIEEHFRKGDIKVICATPTLAMGVNLPAYRVVVRDLRRYEGGLYWIPVLEYKQMAGRAGRPGYDEEGEAICMASTEEEKEEIFGKYIFGEVEDITSKLSAEPVLRMHLLSLIANLFVRDEEGMFKFFSKTFWAKQYGEVKALLERLRRIRSLLEEWGFVEGFIATPLGHRVSELYIDPLSAHHIITCLRNEGDTFGYLHMLCNTSEMKPLLKVRPREFPEIQAMLNEFKLLQPEPSPWDYDYEDFIDAFKTALVFYDWINEKGEDEILDKYRVTPGELYARLRDMDWLLYAASELARLIGEKRHIAPLLKLRVRVKHGVKEELIPLVRFEGIGRVRARLLYNNGIRDAGDIRKASLERLSGLLGRKIAEKLKRQVTT